MRRISMAAIALLLFWTDFARANPGESETVGQFLVALPARSVIEVIDYCSENVPELKDDLLEERAGFIKKLSEAERPLLERLKDDPELNAPVQDSMRQEIAESQLRAMNIFKQQDPGVICRNSLENIRNATVDELRKVVEDNFQSVRGVAQVKN